MFFNDCNVKRQKKGKTGNSYFLNGEELKAFGASVPEEVRKAINFSDLNIQRQLDAPFLLSKSSGEVARYLNKIVHLDSIDSTLQSIESKIRKTNSKYLGEVEDIERLEEDLTKYDILDNIEKDIKEIQAENTNLLIINKNVSGIMDLLEKLELTTVKLKAYEKKAGIDLIVIEKRVEKFIAADNDLSRLSKLKLLVISDTNVFNDYNKFLKAGALVAEVTGDVEETHLTAEKFSYLTIVKDAVIAHTGMIKHRGEGILKLEKSYKKLMPEICPLCMGAVND